MNDTHITVTGRVGTDPELRVVGAGGHAVAGFRLAHQASRLRDGEWSQGPVTWFQVTCWRRLAEHVAASLHRGDPVVVRGRFTVETWTRPDGTPASRHVLVATAVGHDLTHGTSAFTRAGEDGPEEEQSNARSAA